MTNRVALIVIGVVMITMAILLLASCTTPASDAIDILNAVIP